MANQRTRTQQPNNNDRRYQQQGPGYQPRNERGYRRPVEQTPAPQPKYAPDWLMKLGVTLGASWSYFWDPRVLKRRKLIPLFVLLYVASPIDLLPAAILGPLGVTDDLIVAYAGLNWFSQLAALDVLRFQLRQKMQRDKQDANQGASQTNEPTEQDWVEGEFRVVEN